MNNCNALYWIGTYRFSTIKKSPGLKKSFRDKQIFREELKKTKALSRELIQQRNAEKEAKKQKRRDNLARRKENQLKSEVLQVVSLCKSHNIYL